MDRDEAHDQADHAETDQEAGPATDGKPHQPQREQDATCDADRHDRRAFPGTTAAVAPVGSQNTQPGGAGGHDGSGVHPAGGTQSAGGSGHVGGEL